AHYGTRVSFSCYVLYGSDFRRYSPHDFTSAFNAARSASKCAIVLLFRILLATEKRSITKVVFYVHVDIRSLKKLAYHTLMARFESG
ncbi:hypothetical protein BDZ91DRAFT_750902, partial [Kalaharituber pfeilii]